MSVLGVLVQKKDAERLRKMLSEQGLLDNRHKPLRSSSEIIFPVLFSAAKSTPEIRKAFPNARLVRKGFETTDILPRTLREALSKRLPRDLLALVPSSFDLLGDVAIIELDEKLVPHASTVGHALMEINKSVESVYLKTGAHTGTFRSEPVKLVSGKRKKFATYREHGCTFRVSIGKVFFSPRLSTERKRISSLIRAGEVVAALFAGTGPFPIVFARNSKMSRAVAIELNPAAVHDMEENISLNKVGDRVEAVLGDVKELSRDLRYAGRFDRAVMPLPKGGGDFLEDAIRYLKPRGGVVHYYQFVPRNNPFHDPRKQIAAACKKLDRGFEVLSERRVREYSPDTVQVVVDFQVAPKA